jgi:hypothetical protein
MPAIADGEILMRVSAAILLSIIGLGAFATGVGGAAPTSETPQHRSIARESEGRFQVAKACGWYAVYFCSRNAREAENWTYQREAIDSHTIHTNLAQYPNFAPGWACAVDGPMDRESAIAKARQWKDSGSAPTAYAKSAC